MAPRRYVKLRSSANLIENELVLRDLQVFAEEFGGVIIGYRVPTELIKIYHFEGVAIDESERVVIENIDILHHISVVLLDLEG